MSFDPGCLEALGLYAVRTSFLVLFSPILGLVSGVSSYKLALITLLSGLFFWTAGMPSVGALEPIEFAVLGMREALIGFFLAFLAQLVLLAVRVAGALIGQEMGLSMAEQVDPESGISSPLVTRAYENYFLIGFFAVDGHHWILRALARSFEAAPVGSLSGTGVVQAARELLGEMFAAGMAFAVPIMVLLLLTSILLGLLARMVPQLNVLEVGFTLRISLALGGLFLFAPVMAPGMERFYVLLDRWMSDFVVALGG